MNCGNCGGKLQSGDSFCRHCGMPSYAGKEEKNVWSSVLLVFLLMVTAASVIYPIFNNGASDEVKSYRETALRKEVGNYVFYVPEQYSFESDEGRFILMNEAETFGVSFYPVEVSFSTLKNNMDVVIDEIESRGCKVLKTGEKKIKNVEYIVSDASCSGETYVFAYGKINAGNVAELIIYNEEKAYDYSFLEEASMIILSAEVRK